MMLAHTMSTGHVLQPQARPHLAGSPLHARHWLSQKTRQRLVISSVASPSHKHGIQSDRPTDDASTQQLFTSDAVKLSSAPRAGQPGNQTSQRSVHAHASNQQSLSLGSIWGNYQRSVETNPLTTKACTSFFGFVIGDILAQRLTGSTFSILRCLRLGTYGLTLDGPLGHLWYQVLDKTVWPNEPQSNKAVLAKTAADQLIWAPIMTCVFFAVLKSLEGHPELIMQTIQDKLVRTVVANYVLWPAAHFINFKFVPGQHRILYNNCVSVLWTVFLSITTHSPEDDASNACFIVPSNIPEALAYSSCWLQWSRIVWTLYLSCLAHAPVIDTDEMLGVIDQASFLTAGILEQALPESWADELSRAFESLLPDLGLEIPRQIPIVPPNLQNYGL